MHRSRNSRRVVAGAVALGAAAALAATAPAATAAGHRHQLTNGTPGWTHKAHRGGATPAKSTVDFGMVLKMRDATGAATKIKQLSDPSSAQYGKWLTNSQFDAAYAPTASSVHAVQSWLRGQGFAVTKTLPSGMLIEASGSASKVEKTFGTSLRQYAYKGQSVRSNTSGLSLAASTPAAVVSAVSGVVGVDQGSTLKSPAETLPGPPPGERYGAQPCSKYFGQKLATDKPKAYGKTAPYAVCGYGPQQYQSAYGITPYLRKGVDGRGVTVAITDAYASPTILADANKYSVVHNQPTFRAGQFRQILPKANGYDQEKLCGPQGWYGEETLDVEAVHAMAPGANVVYVGGKNCGDGLNDAWATAIDNHVADIVTNSWGDSTDSLAQLGQSYVDFFVQYSTEAALTGITDLFSSGDAGDQTMGGAQPTQKTVDFPADLPYATGVGGTSVAIGQNGQRLGEYGWSNAYSALSKSGKKWTPAPPGVYSSGAGGGTSQLFEQPFYQRGVVPKSISEYYGQTPARAVPDIAMPADPNTGFLVGETQVFPDGTYWDQYRIGGTSLASPLLAGTIAVADQLGNKSLGFINPAVYQLAGTKFLYDETPPKTPVTQVRTNLVNGVDASKGRTYQLQTIDYEGTTLHTARGYDDITGVGSPVGTPFLTKLAGKGESPAGSR